ncbi:hypothetical protein ACQ5SO_13910 [Rhodovulum sp. DZ06]|uniref:hypothetical protein n=1 Tax=Rhodovulum sp. DZ06 TaxID=3425126 RepID=UPI003D34DBF8
MKPSYFILGAPKCGTSAIAQWLGEHPQGFFCDPKEPQFWCTDFPALKEEFGLTDAASYLALFEGAEGRVAGEGSTIYLRSHAAAAEILAFQPDARFIVMLRDPVEVAHALHMERLYGAREDIEDFEEAWAAQEDRAAGRRIPRGCPDPVLLDYRGTAMFGEQLSRLFDVVPRERVLVLFQSELKEDAAAVYARAREHVGLPDDGRTAFGRVNAAHGRRFKALSNFILSPPPPLDKPIMALRQFLIRHRFGPVEWLKSKFNKPQEREEMSEEFRVRLRAEFADDTERLAALLGRRPPWAD